MMGSRINKFQITIASLLLLARFAVPAHGQQQLARQFKDPPLGYRPIPFWHLNGTLTRDEIYRQIADAAKSGFGGVAVLPVTSQPQLGTNIPSPAMHPEYLSKGYFERYEDILRAARLNKIRVILYDDIDFPSGTAGGRLKKLYPEAVRKNLFKTDTMITGPANVQLDLPAGELVAAVAQKEGSAALDISSFVKQGQLQWQVPHGGWKLRFFSIRPDADGIVDYMNPAAVNKFVSLTYDEYAKRFGSYFGSTIRQTFFDDVGYVIKERGWTDGVSRKFKALTGKQPARYYPALWENTGPETEAARVALFDARAELLAEGFPKVIAGWDKRHHVIASGHPPGNYEIQPTDMNFDVFKFYRHEPIPTLDAIFYHGHGRDGFKLISSAAAYYNRPVVASETYGAFSERSFDVNMLYRTAMELFTRGVNFLIPHGMWYDPADTAVRIPPLISPYSKKLATALPAFNAFAARTCMLLQGGKQVAHIGVLYPITSLQAFYHFDAKDNKEVGQYAPPGTDYFQISNLLTDHIHRDFAFIHPQFFAGPRYRLGHQQVLLTNQESAQQFNAIIMPAGNVISYLTLKKLKEFFDQGGKVIATGILPGKSAEFGKDAEVNQLVSEIFGQLGQRAADSTITRRNAAGGKAVFIRQLTEAKLQAVLDDLDPVADVLFENNPRPLSGNGALSYLHKVSKGRHIYYFANSTDDRVDTYVYLKGVLHLQQWNPHSGNIIVRPKQYPIRIKGQLYTRVKLKLPAVTSAFLVTAAASSPK